MSGQKPRILIAGLNPDPEDGILETEKRDIIMPAMLALRKAGIEAEGPIPAGAIFDQAQEAGHSGIPYMYHDRGNNAIKAKMFQTTACSYTRVPYPILSAGYGSALDIAEPGIANQTNISDLLSALTGIVLVRRRLAGSEMERLAEGSRRRAGN